MAVDFNPFHRGRITFYNQHLYACETLPIWTVQWRHLSSDPNLHP